MTGTSGTSESTSRRPRRTTNGTKTEEFSVLDAHKLYGGLLVIYYKHPTGKISNWITCSCRCKLTHINIKMNQFSGSRGKQRREEGWNSDHSKQTGEQYIHNVHVQLLLGGLRPSDASRRWSPSRRDWNWTASASPPSSRYPSRRSPEQSPRR